MKRIHILPIFLILLGLWLPPPSLGAQVVPEVRIEDPSATDFNLSDYAVIWKDADGNATPEDAEQQSYESLKARTLIKYRGAVWAKVRLVQTLPTPVNLVLTHPWPHTDHVSLYLKAEGESIPRLVGTRGDQFPVAEGQRRDLYPSFSLALDPGRYTLYIRVQTAGSVHWDITLSDTVSAQVRMNQQLALMTSFFGIFFAMVSFNFFLYLRLRHLNFLIYCIYLVDFAVAQMILSGLAHYLFGDQQFFPFLANQGIIWTAEIAAVAGSLFTLRFLKLQNTQPLLAKAIFISYPVSLFNIGLASWNFPLASSFILLTNFYIITLELTASIRATRAGQSQAAYFTIAWGLLVLGNFCFVANHAGLIPENPYARWALFVGGSLEAILMSLALGDRMLSINTRRKIAEESLRFEGDARLQLAATIAHKLNNPLHSMQLAQESLVNEVRANHDLVLSLFQDQDLDDPDTQIFLQKFKDSLASIDVHNTVLHQGIMRSTDLVEEVRTVSGVDGGIAGESRLAEVLERVKQRIGERTLPKEMTRLQFVLPEAGEVRIPANIHLLVNSIDPFIKVAMEHNKGPLRFEVKTSTRSSLVDSLTLEITCPSKLDTVALKAAELHISALLQRAGAEVSLHSHDSLLIANIRFLQLAA